ncbi:hypothetical protein VPH35_093055 [Triticum aestivum]
MLTTFDLLFFFVNAQEVVQALRSCLVQPLRRADGPGVQALSQGRAHSSCPLGKREKCLQPACSCPADPATAASPVDYARGPRRRERRRHAGSPGGQLVRGGLRDPVGCLVRLQEPGQPHPLRHSPAVDNYTGLVGFGGHKNLEQLRLGRTTTLRAIAHLSGFAADYAPDADDGCMRRAVATLVVTIFEAARFAPIQQSISDNWVNGVTFKPQQWIVVQWRTVSCALLISRQHGGQWASPETRELRGVQITTRAQAEALVNVLLWPGKAACSEPIALRA